MCRLREEEQRNDRIRKLDLAIEADATVPILKQCTNLGTNRTCDVAPILSESSHHCHY